MRYDRMTRWLHAGIALGIVAQLGLSLFMEVPDEEEGEMVTGLPLELFEMHEKIGLVLLGLLVLHWLWSLSGHVKGGFGHLFPWFSGERMSKVIAEAKDAMSFKFPDPEASNELAGAIHGLGLLCATALAVTGTGIFFNLSEAGHMTELGEEFEDIHCVIAPLMWAYLVGHVAAVGIHKRLGHNSIREILSLFK